MFGRMTTSAKPCVDQGEETREWKRVRGNEGVETGERTREDEGGKSEWGRVRKEWTEE